MSVKRRLLVACAALAQIAIVGLVLQQALHIMPFSYPTELKLLVVVCFILAGLSLSFRIPSALSTFTVICCWWLASVLMFVGNDFGATHPTGDGAKATVILLFGWVPPTVIMLCKRLSEPLLKSFSCQAYHEYIIDGEGMYWKLIPQTEVLHEIKRDKPRIKSVSVRMPTSLVCVETTASREGLIQMKSVLNQFAVPVLEIRSK